ncbi:LCP family protein [Patescibacteria group bacterium]|nr:LCP family protein [Patescibacteria group bacterium]MBU1663614.1 LCP family protein [Patescibacteria group bacterium]MBU1934315.1 LCP family protein [Patescibacteria group bacterium]MBU2233995.1 LCP family protein [Patescibacteria group bacterium]
MGISNIDLLNSKINQVKTGQEKTIKPNRPKTAKPFKPMAFVLVFLLVVYIIFTFNKTLNEKSSSWFYNLPIINQIKHLVESADVKLKGETSDRINILLLGIGGKNHDGGLLTDTIILASLKPSEKKLSLLSIPRDLSVPIENMGWQKINSVNAYAEMKIPNSGGLAISQTLNDIFQIPIDYYLTVDFAGFEKIIDDLGSIKVNVKNTFDDYKYPILGNEDAPWEQRWEHLHIEQGEQIMNGQLALKYVRSRHALGVEGSDFARSHRQQKVLEAVKGKVLSLSVLFKPNMISKIISDINAHYNTNLKIWEIVKLWGLIKDIKSENIASRVLDNSPSGLLTDTVGLDGAYLLSPRSGDFSEIKYLINNIFINAPATDKEKVEEEKATVEIRNGTWINGLASKAALDLEKYGFDIVRIGNTSRQNFEKSVIYDLTYGKKIQALTILKNRTNANVALGMPQWLINDIDKELSGQTNPIQPDFILMLGQEADETRSGTANTEQ